MLDPLHERSGVRIFHADCLEVLRELEDASVHAVVTDPPYGISFMGKRWDYDVPSVEIWAECLRVLKPGGHLLAFAGTRTQHRMAVRIEDAGFEIRDMLAWVYGSGFPKSLDVSKALDKAAGATREVIGSKVTGRALGGSNWRNGDAGGQERVPVTAPATEQAREWSGWGTALKPSLEPITLARKPLSGTVAANVLEHGTGALNVDGCRVALPDGDEGWNVPDPDTRHVNPARSAAANGTPGHGRHAEQRSSPNTAGRWPANLVHDGSAEVLERFPADADTGSAARFFYCGKASQAERGADNRHPTVKPLALMRWLVRLVTPPGGTVLDPFMGSGTTACAAVEEGVQFIGCERELEYAETAVRRLPQPTLGF